MVAAIYQHCLIEAIWVIRRLELHHRKSDFAPRSLLAERLFGAVSIEGNGMIYLHVTTTNGLLLYSNPLFIILHQS